MKRSSLAFLVASIAIALGLGIMEARHSLLKVPYSPKSFTGVWDIELLLQSVASGRSARLSLYPPSEANLFSVTERDFTNPGYSLSAISLEGKQEIIFANKKPAEGEQTFSLRFRLKSEKLSRPLEVIATSPLILPSHDFERELKKSRKKLLTRPKAEVVQEILSDRRVLYPYLNSRSQRMLALQYLYQDGKEFFGFPLMDELKVNRLNRYFLFLIEENPFVYQFSDKKIYPLRKVFLWSEHQEPIASWKGLSEPSWQLSATPVRALLPRTRDHDGSTLGRALAWFSFERLSYGTQFGLRLLLLLPIASLVVAILRNVVGLKTFGTFMPALLALAFRETGPLFGIAAVASVVGLGAVLRLIYKYLRLLFVPRMTASLSVVILIICLGSLVLHDNDFRPSSSLVIFPVIILTMMIERFSVSLEEVGVKEALKLSTNSVLAALLCYAAISSEWINYLVLSFPEVTLLILGSGILLGRYTGYRLFELVRFRDIVHPPEAG
ncbi:MAG: UUP1 family membrane protein [Bdellovibrionales bacterium]|nr:UUP1 family membrane protein [Bdellovibrionales bacterium]